MAQQDNAEREAISGLLRAMCRIQCGSITVVKQDGCVVQITTFETAVPRDSIKTQIPNSPRFAPKAG